ncbi:MAG: WD40 repeat domain-containing protein [Anaerolineales bacterium]|nr:WD40 repeat domain-containing protein [Anaerolineales bacterium]
MPKIPLKSQLLLVAITLVLFSIHPVVGSAQNVEAVLLDVAWSPDGTMLASIANDGTFNITVPSQNTTVFEFARPSTLVKAAVAWNPLGDRLTVGIGNRMYIWNVETWQLLHEYEVGLPSGFFTWIDVDNIPEGVQTITWSLDGRYVVAGTYSYETSVWDTQQGQLIFRDGDLSGGGPGRVWLNNDGRMGDGANWLNAFTGDRTRPPTEDIQRRFGGNAEGGTTEPRPDNSQIAWGTIDGYLLIIDLNTTWAVIGIEVTDSTPPAPRRNISDISWNGTGEFIGVVSNDGELYVVNLATREVATVLNVAGRLTTVNWNPTNNLVTYAGVSSTGESILETVDVSGIAGVPTVVPTLTPPTATPPLPTAYPHPTGIPGGAPICPGGGGEWVWENGFPIFICQPNWE